jgi:hypothetical protein
LISIYTGRALKHRFDVTDYEYNAGQAIFLLFAQTKVLEGDEAIKQMLIARKFITVEQLSTFETLLDPQVIPPLEAVSLYPVLILPRRYAF